jgi:serine/threonine protein kinase
MVSDPEDSTLLGRRIGVYQLQAWLGAGGMGAVYRAHDTRLGRDVAIKILPREFTSDADRRARFERESRVLAALNHPNIAAIYGVEDGPIEAGHDVRALVLELVEGETLAQRIERGPIALADVMAIARQMADALDAAHEGGIIHRDLKPANIKLRADGVVKLLDFGIAKVFVGEGASTEESPTVTAAGTRAGTILGTAAYMSPEHARGRSVDKRTDIWAFGCVLYEMLTGRAPFKGETVSDTLVAILEREPDWRALPGATPPRIRELLRRCLEKDPKRRLRDIADAVIELTPDQSADAGIADPMRWAVSGLRKWIWVAASLALIAAMGTAVWLWPRTGALPAPALTAVPLTTYPGFES